MEILLDNVTSLTVKSLSNAHWESQIKSVKAIRFQGPKLRLALLELYKSCDDAKSKSKTESLVNAIQSFEFLLGLIIWYGILFAINMASKKLQFKSLCIASSIKQIVIVLLFYEKYRNEGFTSSMDVAKSVALEMGCRTYLSNKTSCY